MNYNQEFYKELKESGIETGKLYKIPKEKQGTPEEWAELERKIAIRTRENEIMLDESMEYAKESIV